MILEILGKIGFDWKMALANLVNFLIIFWLLKRYAFAPILNMIKKRQSEIATGLEHAASAKTELTMAKQQADTELHKAREQANQIIASAHEDAKKMVEQAEHRTKEKVQAILQEAKQTIAQQREKMEYDLQTKTVDIALEVAEKIIKKKLDPATEKALINELTQ